MDFFERFFGIAPDQGSGFTELSMLVLCLAIPVGVYWVRRLRKASALRRLP